MVPSVFISSTVEDLRHIRDAVRATVDEIGYRPVMSEYAEIGYMNGDAAEGACYKTVDECQIVVLIVGKRYGSRSRVDSDRTVTENEFDVAAKGGSRIITLVDQDVWTFKKVYENNTPSSKVKFPGMNDPTRTFEFLNRISALPSRNAIIPFSNASEVRDVIKRQLAIMVYNLLAEKTSPTTASINDILCEVKTMRTAMEKNGKPDAKFMAAIRFLLDDENVQVRNLIKGVNAGPIETAIPKIEQCADFAAFLKSLGVTLSIMDLGKDGNLPTVPGMRHCSGFCPWPFAAPEPGEKSRFAKFIWCDDARLMMNDVAHEYFVKAYTELKRQMRIAG